MRRLALIGATAAIVLTAPCAADALTLSQVRAEARDELTGLSLDLVEFEAGDDEQYADEYVLDGSVYGCRRTSRRRGSCIAEVTDAKTGAGCNAYVVVTETSRISDGLRRRVRGIECWL